MKHRAIINVAVGHWYPRGQDRLKRSLEAVGFNGQFYGWRDEYPTGSPTHQQCPDAFKSYAFQHAIAQGCTSLLWLDASAWCERDPSPIFDIIEADGSYFVSDGWSVGQWCKDSALATLGIGREESFTIPAAYCCIMGVNVATAAGRDWMTDFCRICQDGVTLPGPHPKAKPGEISNDPRVIGHAHEQTVASALLHKYGWPLRAHTLFQVTCGQPPRPDALICAAGM